MPVLKIKETRRKWWILGAMAASISMIYVDATVLPVALPTIQRDLNTSELGLQWIVNAYLLALTALLLCGGRLADMLGPRKMFCWGILAFSLSSALCGLAHSSGFLVASRALQGVGGAIMIPTTTAILFAAFPHEERGKALGFYIAIGSVFLALGPFVGGMLTQYLSWRYVFWINLPISVIGLVMTLLVVPPSKPRKETFDMLGFITLSCGVTAIIVALMQSASWGWLSFPVLSLLAIGLLLITLLVTVDRKVTHPFLDINLFKNPYFVGGVLSVFLTQCIVMVTVFWAVFFQTILNYSPAAAGSIALLANVPVFFCAPLAGFLTDRYGAKLPVVLGFFMIILSLLWFAFFATAPSFPFLAAALILFGSACAFIFMPSSINALSHIGDHKRGIASGVYNTMRQFGATLGMALLGTIFLNLHMGRFTASLNNNRATETLDPYIFEGLLTKSPDATEALTHLSPDAAKYVVSSFTEAYNSAFSAINLTAAAIGVIGLLSAYFLFHSKLKTKELT